MKFVVISSAMTSNFVDTSLHIYLRRLPLGQFLQVAFLRQKACTFKKLLVLLQRTLLGRLVLISFPTSKVWSAFFATQCWIYFIIFKPHVIS